MDMEKSGMEKSEIETNMEEQQTSTRKKGGLITLPFIIVNEALEKVSSYGLSPNMILYFINEFHIGVVKGNNILFIFGAATNFLPIVGAFIADSYLGRFLTIGLGSIFSLLGMVVLWSTAMIPKLRPPHCDKALKQVCKTPSGTQNTILLSSFVFMAIGAGGVRPCSLAFGADQFDVRNNPKKGPNRHLEMFFSWYYASFAIAILLALTVIVYIQDHLGWKIGFGIPMGLMFISAITFFLASPFYIKQKPATSLFTSFAQVMVVSYKNRKLSFPKDIDVDKAFHHNKDSKLTKPTDKLRFLNKACIIRHSEDIKPDGSNSNPWGVCSVDQVEELKAVIKITPIWSSCIMLSINISQGAFGILQANTMDRHIGSFQIPAGSFGLFLIVGAAIWIMLYDRILIPIASLIKGKPVRIGLKMRMGVGLFFSILAMVVSAIVEHFRRKSAIKSGFLDNPAGVVAMSALWLIPQHALNGIAEAFNNVAQNEFYYMELPKSLSSFATVLSMLGIAIGNLIANFLLNTVDDLTKNSKTGSWFQDNINKGHFESYYWLLAIMSSVNIIIFIVCCWAYGPVLSELKDQAEEIDEQELPVIGAENGVKREEV